MQRDHARRVLGVPAGAPACEVERAFRRRALQAHPDRGGDADAFRTVLAARSALQPLQPEDLRCGPGVTRTRLVVRHTGARRVLRHLRRRFPIPSSDRMTMPQRRVR